MKKVLISGLVAGLIILLVGIILGPAFSVVFPALNAEYSDTNLFRPFSDPLFLSIYLVHPFVVGILLSWLWSKTKSIIKGEDSYKKGIRFGFMYWVIMLLGLALSYASSPISLLMIISWSVIVLTQALCAGLIYTKMNK